MKPFQSISHIRHRSKRISIQLVVALMVKILNKK